jgi:hypothetical protein
MKMDIPKVLSGLAPAAIAAPAFANVDVSLIISTEICPSEIDHLIVVNDSDT